MPIIERTALHCDDKIVYFDEAELDVVAEKIETTGKMTCEELVEML